MKIINKKEITSLFTEHGSNIPLLAQSIVDVIPSLLSNPDHAHARITLNDLSYESKDFRSADFTITSSLRVRKKCRGNVEIHLHTNAETDWQQIEKQQIKETADWIAELLQEAIRAIPATGKNLDSERLYKLLAENSIDVIWIMDPLLNFTYISPAVERMTGFTVKEWIGTNLSQHATRKEFLKMAAQAVRAMRGFFTADYIVFTASMLRKDGSEFPVEIIGRILFNERGTPIGVHGTTRDISRRKGTETALQETREKYLASLEQLYQAGQRISQSLDLTTIYSDLHQVINEIMPCDGLIISSFNSIHKEFRCEALFHEGQVVDVSDFPPIPLEPEGQGTQSQVVHTESSLYLSDYLAYQKDAKTSYYVNEEGVYKEKDIPADEDITRSAVLVPLRREGQVIGVIQVTSYELDAFSRENLQFLEALTPQVSAAISNAALYEETLQARKNLLITLQGTIEMLARTVEKRDPYTAGHQRRVADLAVAIAEEMDLDQEQIDAVHMAGIVHDIGKINIPAEILSKPGQLTDLEFELIKTHPQVAADLLQGITFPWPIAEIIRQHHEKLDGSGYPRGLPADQIVIEARILTVADIVEAMSSHRPYREAIGVDFAIEQIKKDSGTKLDAAVVEACTAIFARGFQFSEQDI